MALKTQILNNKVVKNFSYVTFGNIIAQAINLFAVLKLAELYNPENYGLYTFLNVQGLLIFTFCDLGTRNIIIRTIARDRSATKDIITNGIIIRICSQLIFSSLYFGYNHIFGHLSTNFVLLVCLYSFFNCITNLFESTFWGHQKMLVPSIVNISTSILWLIIVLFFITNHTTIGVLFLLWNGIYFLTGLTYFIVLKFGKFIIGTRQPFISSSAKILRQSWPYFVLVLLTLPYNYLTNNFLDINSTKTQIGYFNLAQKLMSPITLIITVSLSALFPNLSNLWVTDQERFKRLLNNGVRLFFFIALMLCFLYTAFAGYIIRSIFSNKYWSVIEISQILIWFVFLMGINSLIGTIWGATNHEKLLVKSSIINVIISGPLLYVSSKYGALGLSYGYVLSFAIFEIYLWVDFKRTVNINISQDKILWLMAVLLFIVSYFILKKLSLVINIVISVIVIFITIILFLKKSKETSLIK